MPRLRGSHFSPPSSLTYTPPVLIATVTRSDAGSGSTVCTAPPPPPGSQVVRCGWSHRPRTRSKEQPPSVLRHSECGSQPAQTTSGRSAVSGRSCQTRASAASSPSGKRIAPGSVSCQVAPRSSDHMTVGPQWPYWMPARMRGSGLRVSTETAATSCASRCGPSRDQVRRSSSLRASHSPLRVPMANRSVIAPLPSRRIDVRATVGPGADRIDGSRRGLQTRGRPHGGSDSGERRNSAAGGSATSWLVRVSGLVAVGGSLTGAVPGVPVGDDVGGQLLSLRPQLLGLVAGLAGTRGAVARLLLGQRRPLLDLGAFPAGAGGLLLRECLLLLRLGATDLRLLQVLARLLPLTGVRDPRTLRHRQCQHGQQRNDDDDDQDDDPRVHSDPSSVR